MTVTIILFTQLQGAIHYNCDTNSFVLLFHRVIKPSDLFVPWICGAGRRRILTEFILRFIISLSRNHLHISGICSYFLREYPARIGPAWENRASDAVQVEGREICPGKALADPPDRMEHIRFTCSD